MTASKRIREHIRNNVWGIVATYIALGGTAFAAATVGPTDIKDNAVRSNHVRDGAVATADLADASVTNPKLGFNSINTLNVNDGTILGGDLAVATVTSRELGTSSVGVGEIGTDAVGSSEVATGAVGSEEVTDQSLRSWDIAPNSVGASEATDESLTGTDIDDGSLKGRDIDLDAHVVEGTFDESSEFEPHYAVSEATCPSGEIAIGGGYRLTLFVGEAEMPRVTRSEPDLGDIGRTWHVESVGDGAYGLNAFATCVRLSG